MTSAREWYHWIDQARTFLAKCFIYFFFFLVLDFLNDSLPNLSNFQELWRKVSCEAAALLVLCRVRISNEKKSSKAPR
jgi:hypothetical protein